MLFCMTLSSFKKILILLGPTASGKSYLAHKIASQFNGVIINADSMQVYKNFPVLSAMPSSKEMSEVPHKLYGIFDLLKEGQCSAAQWVMQARKAIYEALESGQLPIVVGGTGFYIKALMEGLSDIPVVPEEVRQFVSCALKNASNRLKLYAHLQQFDSPAASKIPITDTQRLTRALEVLFHTRKPLSFWQQKGSEPPFSEDSFCILSLLPERASLYESINHRTVKLLEQGALEEVTSFKEALGSDHPQKIPLIGFDEISQFQDGLISYEAALQKIQQKTRNYAKRQTTWIRHQVQPDFVISELLGASQLG